MQSPRIDPVMFGVAFAIVVCAAGPILLSPHEAGEIIVATYDWIANTLGGAGGAWLGATLNRAAQRPGRPVLPARERWYEQGPPMGWVLWSSALAWMMMAEPS